MSKAEKTTIRLSAIDIHAANRSHQVELDEDYVKGLATDIRRNGLIHPVTLIPKKDGAEGKAYLAVAGANRLAALRALRGPEGVLQESEYHLLDPSTDEKSILALSMAENRHRYAGSIIQEALYLNRLMRENRLRYSDLRRLTGHNRQKLHAMIRLVQRFDELPESWQHDLALPESKLRDDSPRITLTHWGEAAPKLPEGKFTSDLLAIMEKGRSDRLSARKLAELIDAYVGPVLGGQYRNRLPRPAATTTVDNTEATTHAPADTDRVCAILEQAVAACHGDVLVAHPIRRLQKRIANWYN